MAKLFHGIAAAGALALASAAHGVVLVRSPTTVSLSPAPTSSGSGNWSFTFGDSDASSPFEELVSFSNDVAGTYRIEVHTTAQITGATIDPASDVDFSDVWITPLCPTVGAPASCSGLTHLATLRNESTSDVQESWQLSGLPLGPGSYTLHIAGTRGSSGSFGGSLDFAPTALPEPGTWAMMLLGFGAIGWQLRRRPLQGTAA